MKARLYWVVLAGLILQLVILLYTLLGLLAWKSKPGFIRARHAMEVALTDAGLIPEEPTADEYQQTAELVSSLTWPVHQVSAEAAGAAIQAAAGSALLNLLCIAVLILSLRSSSPRPSAALSGESPT